MSTGKEMQQNAENLKRDFLLCAAEENLKIKGWRPGAGAGWMLTRDGWWT